MKFTYNHPLRVTWRKSDQPDPTRERWSLVFFALLLAGVVGSYLPNWEMVAGIGFLFSLPLAAIGGIVWSVSKKFGEAIETAGKYLCLTITPDLSQEHLRQRATSHLESLGESLWLAEIAIGACPHKPSLYDLRAQARADLIEHHAFLRKLGLATEEKWQLYIPKRGRE